MKILHVSTGDSGGGAARAAYRIHRALLESGIDSRMRVLQSGTGDPTVKSGQHKSLLRRVLDRVDHRLLAREQRGWHTDNPILHTFGQASARLVEELNNSDADILHLHWISGMLSVEDIGRLRKPIVWTLHDMWAFCGGEHYAPDDLQARFRVGYRPDNRTAGERGPDLNLRTWEAKQRAWSNQRFTLVSPSHWLASCVRDSALLGKHPVHVVPNPIEPDYPWRPLPQEVARAALNLPTAAKLILMGADGGVRDPRKGGDLLHAAVSRVNEKKQGVDVHLVIYGQDAEPSQKNWPCPVHWMGTVRDDRVLALAYAAADVMVVPSRQDNLPNTAIEAIACGTPVAAFNVGGLPDIVEHMKTGWLAKPFEANDLGDGISNFLTANYKNQLSEKIRLETLLTFSPQSVCKKYIDIYNNLLKSTRNI